MMSTRSARVRFRSSSCSDRNRCRSSSASNSSSASGLTRPSTASARSAVRSRFCCSSRTYGDRLGLLVVLGAARCRRAGEHRHRAVRAVLGDQRLRVRGRARPSPSRSAPPPASAARPGPSRRGGRVSTSASKSRVSVRTRPAAAPSAASASVRAASAAGPLGRGGGQRRLDPPGQPGRAGMHRARLPPPRAAAAPGGPSPGPGRRRSCCGGPAQGLGPARQRPDPLLHGAQRRAGRPSRRCGPPAPPRPAGPARPDRARPRPRSSLGQFEPVFQVGEPATGRDPAPARPGRSACQQPLRLAVRRPGRGAQLAELLGQRGHAGVRLVQPGQGHLDGLRCGRAVAPPARSGRTGAARSVWLASASRGSASSIAAWTSIRLGCADEPPAAKWALSTSPSRVTATRSGSAADQGPGGRQVVDHGDLAQHPPDGRTQLGRTSRPRRPRTRRRSGSVGPLASIIGRLGRDRARGAVPSSSAGPAQILGLEVVERRSSAASTPATATASAAEPKAAATAVS